LSRPSGHAGSDPAARTRDERNPAFEVDGERQALDVKVFLCAHVENPGMFFQFLLDQVNPQSGPVTQMQMTVPDVAELLFKHRSESMPCVMALAHTERHARLDPVPEGLERVDVFRANRFFIPSDAERRESLSHLQRKLGVQHRVRFDHHVHPRPDGIPDCARDLIGAVLLLWRQFQVA